MYTSIRLTTITLLAAILLSLTLPAVAQQEQSPAQLRIENEQLRDRIDDLERQLASAQRRVDALESANQRLRDRLDNTRNPSSPAPDDADIPDDEPSRETAPIPTDPFASPASMHAKLQRDYNSATQGLSYDSRATRIEYMRAIRKWANQSRRTINGPVTWTASILESSGQRGRVTFTIEILDPASSLPIGDAFDITVSGRNVQKLNDALGNSPVQLEGVFSGTIEIDESMETSEDSMFLGPFAQLSFEVNVRTVR